MRWDYSFDRQLVVQSNGDVVYMDGHGRADTFSLQADGTFAAPGGYFRVLRRNPDASFVMRDRFGTICQFDAYGNWTSLTDRNGNSLTLTYAGGFLNQVFDVFGRAYTFNWGDDGHLSSVVDFANRTVRYCYNAQRDLVSVTRPAVTGTSTGNDFSQGVTTRYGYTSEFADNTLNDLVTTVTSPNEVAAGGPPSITINYGTDPTNTTTYGKVVSVQKGGTNATGVPAGGLWTFAYQITQQPMVPISGAVNGTKQTDPAGNVTDVWFDSQNRVLEVEHETRGLRPGEPDCICTLLQYNADSQVTKSTRPLGNVTTYQYDSGNASRFSQGNLLEMDVIPDAGRGGGEALVTKFTYEPLFNQVSSVIDPRGNSATFAPSIGTASPARYTTQMLFDYQEGSGSVQQASDWGIDLSGMARGLGDLNGDGRTDQIAGNVVEVLAPSVTLLSGSNQARVTGSTSQPLLTQIQWNDAGQLQNVIDPAGNITGFGFNPANDPDGDPNHIVPGNTSTLSQGYVSLMDRDVYATGRRTEAAPAAGLVTFYYPDQFGRNTYVLNPRGVWNHFEWDALDQLVSVQRACFSSAPSAQLPLGSPGYSYKTSWFHDANGNVVQVQTDNRDGNTPELGSSLSQTFAYDILNHLVTATAQVDATHTLATQLRYTPNELLNLVTKPAGNQVYTEYDERDLVFKVTRGYGSTGAAPSTVQYNYDQNANLQQILDPEHLQSNGQPAMTVLAYDGYDRLSTATDEIGGQAIMAYDPASQVVKRQLYGHPANQPSQPVTLLAETLLSRDELSRVYQVDRQLFLAQGFTTQRPFSSGRGVAVVRHRARDDSNGVRRSVEKDVRR